MVRNNFIVKILFFALLLFFGCNNTKQQNDKKNDIGANSDGQAAIQFENTIHDFGKISQGEVVSFTFFYENVGSANLIVKDVKASCGCTIPKWTKEPLSQGEKGKIVVTFDSSGRSGKQHKVITVSSNSSPNNIDRLTITADII